MKKSQLIFTLFFIIYHSLTFSACEKNSATKENSIIPKVTSSSVTTSGISNKSSTIINSAIETFKINEDLDNKSILHAMGSIFVNEERIDYANTYEAFFQYYEEGSRYFELDLIFSEDNEIIGSHYCEYIDKYGYSWENRPTLKEFEELEIVEGYTGITSAKLLQLIANYPDARFVIDTKEYFDYKVYIKLQEDADMKGIDISYGVIPQLYSQKMYDKMKDMNFHTFVYTAYFDLMGSEKLLEIVCQDERIKVLTVPYYYFDELDYASFENAGKVIWVHTLNDTNMIKSYYEKGVSGFYTDIHSQDGIEKILHLVDEVNENE